MYPFERNEMKKIITPKQAVEKIKSGDVLMIGGFLANGSPHGLIECLLQTSVHNLTVICSDTAYPDRGIGRLIHHRKVAKVITSHIGTNPDTIEQMNAGTLAVEFCPQGSLAERIRSGGAGLGGVLTPTGLGTLVEEGKEKITVDGKTYLLEKPLRADVALIGASVGDTEGNLWYRGTSQVFNPLMATAADCVIAEVNQLEEVGRLMPEQVHTPGIFVDFIIASLPPFSPVLAPVFNHQYSNQ
jgi:acetate CoA/acetoacetate CoA-transferase alpha subunit